MQLVACRVQNYKAIDDSGWIPIETGLTAVVGKNEIGKTTLLQALWKTKNVTNVGFDKLQDFPRDRFARERKGTQDLVSLQFSLAAEDAQSLAERLPAACDLRPRTAVYTNYYDGERAIGWRVRFDDDVEARISGTGRAARAALQAIAASIPGGHADEAIRCVLTTACDAIPDTAEIWEPRTREVLASCVDELAQWVQRDAAHQYCAPDERARLGTMAVEAVQGDPAAAARAWVAEAMPSFIYFDKYGQLESRIYLPAYLKRCREPHPDSRTRTQMALFDISGLDPAEVLELGRPRDAGETDADVQRRRDMRRALLDSASFEFTGDWIDWWSDEFQRMQFDVEDDELILRISDSHNPFPILFEERGYGFQWFFAFYLVFFRESSQTTQPQILLLDEPGLHLHPTLQRRLIEFLAMVAQTRQLVYSTHLPFLIDGTQLSRVRTVYRNTADPRRQTSTVSEAIRPTGDPDTAFPVLASLSYALAQDFLAGQRTVLLQDLMQYWLLKTIDAAIRMHGDGAVLADGTALVPAGDASHLLPLGAMMLKTPPDDDRRLVVLVDSEMIRGPLAQAVREAFAGDLRLLVIDQAIGQGSATIEDLIPRDVYVEAVRRQTDHSFALEPHEHELATNVAAVDSAYARHGWGRFSREVRAAVVMRLIGTWMREPGTVPKSTRVMASALFEAINARLAGER